MSWLYPITHNIPSFIRTPAIALLGSKCYTDLIYDVQLDHIFCLKYGISKALSVLIVVGSSIVKIPQIIKIINSRSARGLSLLSFLIDTLGLIIIVGYNYRHEFPITTYGESFLLFVQNIIVISLILTFSERPKSILLTILTITIPILSLTIILIPSSPIPSSILQLMMSLSIPISLASKLPQIVTNHEKRSTGQLSSFLIFSSFLGCLARLFTTLTETGDLTLLINFGCGSFLNGILSLQMLRYWKSSQDLKKDDDDDDYSLLRSEGDRVELSSRVGNISGNSSNNRFNGSSNESRSRNHLSSSNSSSRNNHNHRINSPSINLNAPKQWTRKAD